MASVNPDEMTASHPDVDRRGSTGTLGRGGWLRLVHISREPAAGSWSLASLWSSLLA
jgi:hypothetical protein